MKNREKLLAALGFLFAVANEFSSELASLINPGQGNQEGKARLTRHTVYVRKDITGAGGIFNVIDENTLKVEGVSSLTKTSLPKNQAVIFDKIAIGYALGTVVLGEEGKVDYGKDKAPAEIRNATLVITQNGREVLELPVADMIKGDSANNAGDLYHDLEGFHYLVDDQPMEWQLKFPKGVNIVGGGINSDFRKYLEVRIQGFKTSRKQ